MSYSVKWKKDTGGQKCDPSTTLPVSLFCAAGCCGSAGTVLRSGMSSRIYEHSYRPAGMKLDCGSAACQNRPSASVMPGVLYLLTRCKTKRKKFN
jgi:hypothetical protein